MDLTKSKVIAITFCALVAASGDVEAQANCNMLPHGAGRANCYGRQSQIYRQQSQSYNGIAQQQYRQHQQVGQALRSAPLIGRYAAPAWNVPRQIYTYRYGRP